MNYKTEKYAEGKFFVMTTGEYPERVGHIVGAKNTWLAEKGPLNLGYFRTKKAAMNAITKDL